MPSSTREVYIVNDRTDGQVTVTIHVAMIDFSLPGTIIHNRYHACSRRATKARVSSFRTAGAIHMI